MIYCQISNRVHITTEQELTLNSVARVIGPEEAGKTILPCPEKEGVWKLESLSIARALKSRFPHEEITLLGADICYIHRMPPSGKDFLRPLRTAAALLILLMGSALGLAWFHSDVDMPQAQLAVFTALTGQQPPNVQLITVPYCIGVALGAGIFYALPSRKATTPLEVKLSAYQEDMEKTEGKNIE